jgi:hypothetical protein
VTEQVSLLAKRSFVESCRSPATRRHYIKAVKYFMRYLNLPSESYDKLIEKDPKLIQMDICDFISYLKERKNSSATISLYLAAIAKFYTMNDLTPTTKLEKDNKLQAGKRTNGGRQTLHALRNSQTYLPCIY